MESINKKQSILVSFLAGAVIVGTSVYLSKKENRDDLTDKLEKMKTNVLTKSQGVTGKIKDVAQQLHTTTVEKATLANQKIQNKADQLQKTARDLHNSLDEKAQEDLKEL